MTHMMGFNEWFGAFDHYPLIDKLSGTDFADGSFTPVEVFLQGETCKLVTLTEARTIDEDTFAYALEMVNAAFLAGYKVGRNPDLLLLAQGEGKNDKA